MTQVSAGLTRVPNLFVAQMQLNRINRGNVDLFRVEERLATGRDVNRFSDDSVRASAISALDQSIERSGQWLRNLDVAQSALDRLDVALGDAQDVTLEAKSIASEFINVTFSADDRAGAAVTVDSLIQKAFEVANRKSNVGFMFGGDAPGARPVEAMLGGYAYRGAGDGLRIDLGPGVDVPLTLGPGSPLGGTSARVAGSVELRPPVTEDTPVADLLGARGTGIDLGSFRLAIGDATTQTIDLSGVDTAGDIADAIEAAIRAVEAETEQTILGPQGVRFDARALRIDLEPDGGGGPELAFTDIAAGTAAADLGLLMDGGMVTPTEDAGADLNPRLSWLSPIETGDELPLGAIRIRHAGQTRVVDLSSARTMQDLRNAIEATDLGVRLELDSENGTINLVSDLAVARGFGLSVEEIDGNDETASRLGIRSFSGATPVDGLNDGAGVRIIDDQVDPITGEIDPERNTDFRVTLGNGVAFDVDLRPEDLGTIAGIAARINAAAADAGVLVPGDFEAGVVASGPGGLALRQDPEIGGTLTLEPLNASRALQDLGLGDAAFDAASSMMIGEDVGQVRVRNLFSDLLDLRQALSDDDVSGIGLAGESIEQRLEAVAQVRAINGGNGRRVQDAADRQEDIVFLDQATRSGLRDTNFAEAAITLSQLQTQLQASLQVTAISRQQSLLDFLG
ncbi:MAG: flagellin [Planctomycetota bacterium]